MSFFQWGPNGRTYYEDMDRISDIVKREVNSSMKRINSVDQQSVVHPHMALGFPIASDLKLAIARSHARAETVVVRNAGLTIYDDENEVSRTRFGSAAFGTAKKYQSARALFNEVYRELGSTAAGGGGSNMSKSMDQIAATRDMLLRTPFAKGYRIRVGYVSANIKAKSTVYMAQDLMRFHDRSRFEVHVYATTPQDTPEFLQGAMRGIDWRRKVARSVEFFHEVDTLNVKALAETIRRDGIHILVNWDGYSNNGVRATGLFPMLAAPLQVAHQEYIGTMGADYIQYLITDPRASPLEYSKFYSEKVMSLCAVTSLVQYDEK